MRVITGVVGSLTDTGLQGKFLASQQVRTIEASAEGRAGAFEMR
jgi:hypothetical protein